MMEMEGLLLQHTDKLVNKLHVIPRICLFTADFNGDGMAWTLRFGDLGYLGASFTFEPFPFSTQPTKKIRRGKGEGSNVLSWVK
jgi:hypothetical protein